MLAKYSISYVTDSSLIGIGNSTIEAIGLLGIRWYKQGFLSWYTIEWFFDHHRYWHEVLVILVFSIRVGYEMWDLMKYNNFGWWEEKNYEGCLVFWSIRFCWGEGFNFGVNNAFFFLCNYCLINTFFSIFYKKVKEKHIWINWTLCKPQSRFACMILATLHMTM